MRSIVLLSVTLLLAALLGGCSANSMMQNPVSAVPSAAPKIADCTPLLAVHGLKSDCQQPCSPGESSSDGCLPNCISEGNCGQPPPSGGGGGGGVPFPGGGGGSGGCPIVMKRSGNIRTFCGGGGGGRPVLPPPGSVRGCPTVDSTAARSMYNNFNSALAKQRSGGEWEAAGYIYSNDSTGQLYDQYLGLFELSGSQTQIPAPSDISGYTLVAWYHIHPDNYNFGNGNGVENGSHFSGDDQRLSELSGIIGYVAEYNDIGPNDGDPNSYVPQESLQWYSFTPKNQTSGSETSKGALTSAKGC